MVVIGAGFALLSATHRLVQLDACLNVIELAKLGIAEGKVESNAGFMIDQPHDLATADYAGSGDQTVLILFNCHPGTFARGAVSEYHINLASVDPGGKVNGTTIVKADAHNRSCSAHLAGLVETSEHLDARVIVPLMGSHYYQSGLYTSGTLILKLAGIVGRACA